MTTIVSNRTNVLGAVEFDKLISLAAPWNLAAPIFDLSHFGMVTPGVLTQLAALCHYLGSLSKNTTLVVPDPRVRTYLCRARFVDVVAPVVQFEPPMLDFGAGWLTSRGHGRQNYKPAIAFGFRENR